MYFYFIHKLFSTLIKVSFTLKDIDKNICYEDLETICNSDLAQISPQCFSAKFVDVNLKPVLFYFGFRREDEGKTKVGIEFNFIF